MTDVFEGALENENQENQTVTGNAVDGNSFFDGVAPATNSFPQHPVGDFYGRLDSVRPLITSDGSVKLAINYKSDQGTAGDVYKISGASSQNKAFMLARFEGGFGISAAEVSQAVAGASNEAEIVNRLVKLIEPKVGSQIKFKVRKSKDGQYHNVVGGPDGVVPVLLGEEGEDPWSSSANSADDLLNQLDI